MANHQVRPEHLTPGATIIVEGKLLFSRLRSTMGPEEIDKVNQARTRSKYMLDRNKPITQLRLSNARVVPANPDQMTVDEFYIHERMYETASHPEFGRQYSIDNKGQILPVLGRLVDGKIVQIQDSEIPASEGSIPTEPARGQNVLVVLSVFATKMNNGVGIAVVVFPDEPQWFTGAPATNIDYDTLAARGIVFASPVVPTSAPAPVAAPAAVPGAIAPTAASAAAPVFTPPAPAAAAPVNTVVDQASGLSMPAPVTTGVAPAVPPANPIMAALAQAQAQQTDQQPQAAAAPASPFGPTPDQTPAPTQTPATPAPVESPWDV